MCTIGNIRQSMKTASYLVHGASILQYQEVGDLNSKFISQL